MHKKQQNFLPLFLSSTGLLILIGFIFIYSSSAVYAQEQMGAGHYYLKKQLIGLLLGLVGMFFAAFVPKRFIKNMAPFIFFSTLLFTILTLAPGIGRTINGSRRWLMLGPLSLQPSELLKHAFVIYFSWFLAKKEHVLSSITRGYLPCLVIMALPSLVLLKQPDFGMAMTLCATGGLLLFIAAIPLKFLLATLAASIPGILYLIFKTPYRLHRILSFLNPWDDPQGSGFQIIQSLIAIGSGGFFGRGIGSSKQKFFYLPMQHTDFIFSIIAEETGFVGASILIFLFILFLYSGLKIAWSLKDQFSVFTVLGFTLLVSLQAITNLLVTIGLLPTKGVGLPFVSYGNSALIGNLVMLGVVVNLIKNDPPVA